MSNDGESYEPRLGRVRDLIEDWRDDAELYMESDVDSERAMALQQWKCANELERILEDG